MGDSAELCRARLHPLYGPFPFMRMREVPYAEDSIYSDLGLVESRRLCGDTHAVSLNYKWETNLHVCTQRTEKVHLNFLCK